MDYFNHHTTHLLADDFHPNVAWINHINKGPPLIHSACPEPSPSLQSGADLPHNEWVRLNCLCSGTAQVGMSLQLWGLQESLPLVHVVIQLRRWPTVTECSRFKAPDPETIHWLRELPIELLYDRFDLICIRLYIYIYTSFFFLTKFLLKMKDKI